MSIYTRLFTRLPTLGRTPLEDFLTEALADLLNRMPPEDHSRFIADVLLSEAGRTAWLELRARLPGALLTWVTQLRVRGGKGIIDLVLLVDGRPAIAVENKVGAPVGSHADDEQEADVALPALSPSGNQLRTYGTWLAAQPKADAWPGALVLLTHSSDPPADYGPLGYGVPHVVTCRWGRVWSWARSGNPVPHQGDETTAMWVILKRELAEFLEGKGMSADYMTRHDVAQAQVFMAAADRIAQTFAATEKVLQRLKDELGTGRFHHVTYNSKGALAWACFYLREPRGWNWSLCWGMRFPEGSQYWIEAEPPLPEVPHVFVCLAYEEDRYAVPARAWAENLPAGWQLGSATELVAARPLNDLPLAGEAFASEFGRWVAMSIDALKPALPLLVNAATALVKR